MFGMVIDTGPSASQYMILRLIIFMLKFCVKVFTVSVFDGFDLCIAFDGFDSCMAW